MNFIFHHSGHDITLPALLVQSILKTNPGSTILQVSDTRTNRVPGITDHIQFNTTESILSKQRCEMYAKLTIDTWSVYLDTDTLVIKSITEKELFEDAEIVLCKRYWDGMIHSMDTEERMYKFRNQSLKEVWPYLACFIACHDSRVWKELHKIIQTLPWEKNDWFADQHALKILSSNIKIKLVSEQQYGCLPETGESNIKQASIIHFKGSRKNLMNQYYHNILC